MGKCGMSFEAKLYVDCVLRTMAVVLLLSFAAFSKLEPLRVPDLNQLQDKGIRICERWAFPGSSIEQMVVILRALRAKCIDTG